MKHKPPERLVESKIIKPQPRTFSKNSLLWLRRKCSLINLAHKNSVQLQEDNPSKSSSPPLVLPQEDNTSKDPWLESLLVSSNSDYKTETPSISWPEDEPTIGYEVGHKLARSWPEGGQKMSPPLVTFVSHLLVWTFGIFWIWKMKRWSSSYMFIYIYLSNLYPFAFTLVVFHQTIIFILALSSIYHVCAPICDKYLYSSVWVNSWNLKF